MLQRLIRLLTASLNIYSFYAHPVRYILSVLMVILVPYLAYIFWGSLLLIVLIAVGIYLLYQSLKPNHGQTYS